MRTEPAASQSGTPEPAPRGEDLEIVVDPGDGSAVQRWTLRCDPPGGTHPSPAEACAALSAVADPFAPKPRDVLCTQQYGGPERATIRGTWRGRAVEASYKRTDGCEIARWDRLRAVFGVT